MSNTNRRTPEPEILWSKSHSEKVDTLDLALETFLDHFQKWLIQQPEFPLLMGLADRQSRKKAGALIAHAMTTVPARDDVQLNRGIRRRIIKEMRKGVQNG